MDLFTELLAQIAGEVLVSIAALLRPSPADEYRGPGKSRFVKLPPEEAELRFRVNERMEQLRANREELLARFDLNGDKVLDEYELRLARTQLAAEIRAELEDAVAAAAADENPDEAGDSEDGAW